MSLVGAAMLACCIFFAIAAYRRRKKASEQSSLESAADNAAPPDPSFPPGVSETPVERMTADDTAGGNFFTNLFNRQQLPSRRYAEDDPSAETPRVGRPRRVVVPGTGLRPSDSVVRSLQSQADLVVASKTRSLLRDMSERWNASRVSSERLGQVYERKRRIVVVISNACLVLSVNELIFVHN